MQVLRLDAKKAAWQEALEEFLWRKQAEGASERTLKDYRDHVNRFFNRFFEKFPFSWPDNLKPAVYQYMAEKVSNNYCNLRLLNLRAFFQHCLTEGYIDQNPLAGFKKKKQSERFVNVDLETLKALLDLPDKRTFTGLRDHTLLLLTLDTGIRPSDSAASAS